MTVNGEGAYGVIPPCPSVSDTPPSSGKYQAHGIRPVLEEVAHFLGRLGLDVTLEHNTALNTGITDHPSMGLAELGAVCDLAVVVGGDGTMLHIARELARPSGAAGGDQPGAPGFLSPTFRSPTCATR